MVKLVRILAFILLLGTTIVFVLKLKMTIPIEYKHLFMFFIIGAVSLLWANFREKTLDK